MMRYAEKESKHSYGWNMGFLGLQNTDFGTYDSLLFLNYLTGR